MTSGILNPTGVGVVHGQDDADGRAAAEGVRAAAEGVRVAAWVELDPEVRLAIPQPHDLENPDVAPSRRSGSTAPKADL